MRSLQIRLRLEALDARELPSATALDLTVRGSSGEINGAIFAQDDAQPTGSGHIHPFVRIQGSEHGHVSQGYNTDARPLQFDEKWSPRFTHSLHLSDVPRVSLDGQVYRVFVLDLSPTRSRSYLSLDEVQIFTADRGNLTRYKATTGTLGGRTAVYDLDAGGNSWIKLDARLNSGRGFGDMLMYVPESAFANAAPNDFVYLYSRFGEHYWCHEGFQQWAPGPRQTVTTGSISGNVLNSTTGEPVAGEVIYIDLNSNGVRDADEPFTTTDGNGNFTFAGLATGSNAPAFYRIRQELPDGYWTQLSDDPADIVLHAGDIITGVNFTNTYFNGDN
ncbi:MAG: carboxypeptidase-like regulatory domain-containing protein [Gemmataceae bacterium]